MKTGQQGKAGGNDHGGKERGEKKDAAEEYTKLEGRLLVSSS